MLGFEDIGFRLDLLISGWVGWGLLALAVVLIMFGFMTGVEGIAVTGVFAGLIGGITVIVWIFLLIPFDTKYHKVYRVEGTVLSVSNVLSEASGDLTRVPVLELDTVDRPVTIEDPRAVSLEGKDVSLICDVTWVYRGADRFECRIGD